MIVIEFDHIQDSNNILHRKVKAERISAGKNGFHYWIDRWNFFVRWAFVDNVRFYEDK